MRVKKDKNYAVITGDIVASTKLATTARRRLHTVMKQGSRKLRSHFPNAIPLDVDIYSGDGWQVVVSEPDLSLRIALFYRAFIQSSVPGVDTRMAIAIGTVDFIPAKQVSEGEGEAFRTSGRLLGDKKSARRMYFAASDASLWAHWTTVFHLLDAVVVGQWTDKRAKAIMGALLGWTQQEIAGLWKPAIKQPTVRRHLQGAGWEAIQDALTRFEGDFHGI